MCFWSRKSRVTDHYDRQMTLHKNSVFNKYAFRTHKKFSFWDILYMWKFSPGENFANACCWRKIFLRIFCTVKILTHSCVHTYAHSNSQSPPTSCCKVTHMIGEIKFGEIFVSMHSNCEPLANILASKKFIVYGTWKTRYVAASIIIYNVV